MRPLSEGLYVFLSSCSISEDQSCDKIQNESFFSSFKVLLDEGYLKVATNSFAKRKAADAMSSVNRAGAAGNEGSEEEDPDTGKTAGTKLMIRLRIWHVIPDFLPHCRT